MKLYRFLQKFRFLKKSRSRHYGDRTIGIKARSRKVRIVLKSFGRILLRSRFVKISFLGLLLCGLVIFFRYFLFSSRFNIKVIEVSGNELLEEGYIESKLNYLLGQNIFLIRGSKLKSEVEKFSPYIKSTKVEKELPDKINISLEEREPYFIWVDLSGMYLIDLEGVVLEVVSNFENLELKEEDFDLLKGYGDISSFDSSEDSIDSSGDDLEQEDGEGVEKGEEKEEAGENSIDASQDQLGQDEEILSKEERLELIENRRKEVVSKVNYFWEQKIGEMEEIYRAFPLVYSYEVSDYKIKDSIEETLISATKAGLGIDFLEEDPEKYIWESSYRFVIYLPNLREICFSTRRDFGGQVEDLSVLLMKLKNEGKEFSYIDLSSEFIVYEFEE